MSIRISMAVLLFACSVAVLIGCSDDDPAAPPSTGTIVIDVQPNLAGAVWELTLPHGGSVVGSADTTMTDMKTGTYTLTWQPVAEYTTPAPFTGNLAKGVRLVLTGVYVWIDPNSAVIVVDVEPDEVDASWLLVRAGQSGGIVGRGDGVESGQVPGDYRVEWRDVVGYATPDTVTMAVASPGTTTFTGLYEVDSAQYPVPRIGWMYDNPLPQGFAHLIRGSAVDDVDGFMAPTSFVWTSSLDGVIASGVDAFTTDALSVGEHMIELAATDSHGFTGTVFDSVRIVAAPAQQPVVFIDRPDWGSYDVAQSAGASPTFGWDGSDAGSGTGHPAYVRFLFRWADLPGGVYATTRLEVETYLDDYTDSSDPDWSSWLPWDTDPAERLITFPNLQVEDPAMTVYQYVLAIQAWSETGAIGTTFTYAGNVAHFNALEP